LRRSVKYGVWGGVVAGLVAALFAGFAATTSGLAKPVIVNVDGQPVALTTSAHHVGDVLKQLGYSIGAHDEVAPAAGSTVRSGDVVVLRRARELDLQVDGTATTVWTTALNVGDALTQLGYSEAAYSSVARTEPLALGLTAIEVRTPKAVVLSADGEKRNITTTAATVRGVLTALGVTVSKRDIVKPALTAPVRSRLAITLIRVKDGRIVVREAVPFPVTERPTATMTVGQTKLVRAGQAGAATVAYKVTYRNGKIVAKTEVNRHITKAPVPQVVKVGTKPKPVVITAGTPVAAGPIADPPSGSSSVATPAEAQNIAWQLIRARGWGRSQFTCLAQLWGHESGWRVTAGSPGGTYGIPQANPGSKMSVAGADWQTSARTQILWGLGYITAKFGTPCGAWASWQANGWY
jgi:uncharacterized protein YabE (DUF348 family)